jgi:aryl-alcohol dehydrogenase-like predicted oxidoreductase
MQYVRLGRSGLRVSRLVLGTVNFGPQTPENEARLLLDAAVDAGINFIDTADSYGTHFTTGDTEPRVGWSEQIIGRWLRDHPGRRDQLVLATKCYNEVGPGPNDRGLSAYHIRRACDASLQRLGVDHIDLYQMHHVDRDTPWDEIWQTYETLIRQGKVTYIGTSNFAAWHLATACCTAQQRGLLGPICEQSRYGLYVRDIELEVLPACRHHGLGCIAWSPLHSGILTGADALDEVARRGEQQLCDEARRYRPQVTRYEALCREIGHPPADVALAWILHNPDMTGPIIGPRTVEHLHDSLRALDVKLDDDVMKKLDEIWPGPGGEAPEAYAW